MSDWKPKSYWCHLLLLTLFFPPLTCRFIANSTESSQQRHEPMPASPTFWSTRVGESRETWPKDHLFSWSSSHLVVVLLSWRWGDTFRILHMLHVDATRCCTPPPAVARFFRSLAARQGRCQPHFSVLDWDFSKLFELNEMVIQQKMRWVLQLDMNLMAKSPCLIEFNIYKDQKRCEYTSKCLVHARQDFRFVHPDDYASKPNFSQSGCPNPTLPHRVAIFTLSTWVTWLNKFQFEQSTQIFDSNLSVTFVWVNKKIIKKKLKPSTIWSPHQFPFKPTSSYIQPCHSIQVALSGSDPKLKQRDLPWFQPWTKPTTRSGFKLDHIRPANDMEWQQHQTTSSSSSSSSSSSNNIIIIILPIMDL